MAAMSTPAALFERVVKDFRRGPGRRSTLRALDNVSFQVNPGEVVGLVGPNRAGKTTLVKLLLSLARPTSGTVKRLGAPAANRGTLARVGFMHENQAFPRYLSAPALLEFYAAMSLMPEPLARARADALLKRVGLADRARESIARFSKGMVQRLGLAQALMNEPDLLVLDEPSEGLDLPGRQLLREVLLEHKRLGRAALYVSHVLGEVESVCDRIAVLVAGRLVFYGGVTELCADPKTGARQPLERVLQKYYASP